MTVLTLLKVAPETHADIWDRLNALGDEYVRDYTRWHKEHGTVIAFGEIGLVKDDAGAPKCAICGGKHDNDALTDICKGCEARINEEGSP